MKTLIKYDFGEKTHGGILICAGGFEDRATAYVRHLSRDNVRIEDSILLRYESQSRDNQANFNYLQRRLSRLLPRAPSIVRVHSAKPHDAYADINKAVRKIMRRLRDRHALVDISGMTQLLALCTVHACFLAGLRVSLIYTEAKSYFPLKRESKALLRAWRNADYEEAAVYLQSEALRTIHILPEFAGTFGRLGQSCLVLFVGYEPNRIEGLLNYYAPDRLIVCYGRSPHPRLKWRTQLSKDLHDNLFRNQHVREIDVSTLDLDEIRAVLEGEFSLLHEHYDIAIAPQCAKMQAIAAYLFWRSHPEVQLVFTSPVRFNPNHYSSRAGRTFWCELPDRRIMFCNTDMDVSWSPVSPRQRVIPSGTSRRIKVRVQDSGRIDATLQR